MIQWSDLISMFGLPFIQYAFIGGICAALLCSIIGVFIVLRRSSLIGEGVAHLSFGGIAVGLFFAIYPMLTAMILSLLGILAISYLQRKKIVYSETAIGILFSLGLAVGAVLSSMRGGFSVDLFSYLFGSILTISPVDLALILVLTIAVMAFVITFFKELIHMTFDEQGARLSEVPTKTFDLIFNIVVALTVIVSIKIIGTLLVSSLLIIPAASAMQLSNSFRGTVKWSIMLSVIAVILGLIASFAFDVATGGAIVLISVAIFVICVLMKKIRKQEQAAPVESACK